MDHMCSIIRNNIWYNIDGLLSYINDKAHKCKQLEMYGIQKLEKLLKV